MSNWFVSDEPIERELKNRDGSKARIWYREMSEKDSRQKMSRMMSFGTKGDANSARIDYEKSRAFELQRSIVDWDLTGPDGTKVAVSAANIERLPEYVSNQINKHLREINDFAEEDEDGENPTNEDSDEPSDEPSPVAAESPAENHTPTTTTGQSQTGQTPTEAYQKLHSV